MEESRESELIAIVSEQGSAVLIVSEVGRDPERVRQRWRFVMVGREDSEKSGAGTISHHRRRVPPKPPLPMEKANPILSQW